MSQTPYELLLRKSKQRKAELSNSIEQKNLKNRSISYNMQLSSDFSQDPQAQQKGKQKQEKQTRMNFTNCLKKSYYFRKFLNKTAEGHFTHQEFYKFKDTFNKIAILQSQTDKNPAIFREIWEQQIQRKYSLRVDDEKELQLLISPKKNAKKFDDSPISLTETRKNTEENKRKVQNISEIARRRKMSLDFELQIQGNKKYIRAKDFNLSKYQKNLFNSIEEKSSNIEQPGIVKIQQSLTSENDYQGTKAAIKKPINIYFKKGQQTIGNQPLQQRKSVCIKIKKIRPDKRRFLQDFKLNRSNNVSSNRYQGAKSFVQTVNQREIKSSWNPSYDPQVERYCKVQTSQKCRISIRRQNRVQPGFNQNNDIQGWNVKAENQDQNLQVFGV